MPVLSVVKGKVPVKIWSPLEEVEGAALTQLKNIASLPFVYKHVAAMPDVHLGKGATVGSVIATKGAICPAAVGVDIGCGMMAVKTQFYIDELGGKLSTLRSEIEKRVPVGHHQNKEVADSVFKWGGWGKIHSLDNLDDPLKDKAFYQMGTLGGGNHFVEICHDENQKAWIMLHSGSRNIGNVLAKRHIDNAKGIMKQMFIGLPDPDLAYFAEGTASFESYWQALQWCQSYAFENRIEMMRRVKTSLERVLGEAVVPEMEVNCHHNYTEREAHFGENVLVTRKGAVRAQLNDLGIIPGSMGAKSYIVRGKGVAESFHSCSHGAGRRMSRTEAKKRFTVKDLEEQTRGVECRKDEGVLDEIPGAYKDIDRVMENQSDLVEVVAVLKQVLCVKG